MARRFALSCWPERNRYLKSARPGEPNPPTDSAHRDGWGELREQRQWSTITLK
jgi:hypothetical protein